MHDRTPQPHHTITHTYDYNSVAGVGMRHAQSIASYPCLALIDGAGARNVSGVHTVMTSGMSAFTLNGNSIPLSLLPSSSLSLLFNTVLAQSLTVGCEMNVHASQSRHNRPKRASCGDHRELHPTREKQVVSTQWNRELKRGHANKESVSGSALHSHTA
jgi:hypothetical protein